MAQVQDLSGLLTGISSQAPIDPRVNLTPMQALRARGLEANQDLRKAAGGLMSTIAGKEINVQTTRERAQSELASLDINNPKDQPRILEIYTRLDPNKAAQLKAAFDKQGRDRTLIKETTDSSVANRQSVASQLGDEYEQLRRAVINEQGTGRTNALDAALKIIQEQAKPVKPEKDTANIAEWKLAVKQGYKGTLQDWILAKKTPLVSTVESTASKNAAARVAALFAPLDTVVTATQEKAIKAVDTRQNAINILKQVERDATTGSIQGMTSDLYKFAQSAYQAMGIPIPSDITEKTTTKAFYQKLAAEGLLPRIAEQGRGFTDPERTFFLNEVLPSYNQTFQFNELSGTMQLVEAQMDMEENGFAQARRAYYVTENIPPTIDTHAEAFSNYLERLPMAKFEKHTRKVGTKDVTYDRMVALQDNAKLYQYWTDGKAPTGFTIPIKNKKTGVNEETDLSWGQINALAKKNNTTPRQLLAQAQRTGNLIKATY